MNHAFCAGLVFSVEVFGWERWITVKSLVIFTKWFIVFMDDLHKPVVFSVIFFKNSAQSAENFTFVLGQKRKIYFLSCLLRRFQKSVKSFLVNAKSLKNTDTNFQRFETTRLFGLH